MAKHKDGPIDFFQTHEVFEAERKELKFGGQPTALCLSGGGIRSAAFCLGAVQALASVKLLHQFDYLSTVSAAGISAHG